MKPVLVVPVLVLCGGVLLAQSLKPANADGPAFVVASVKANPNPDGPRQFAAQPGGVVVVNETVRELIYSAYQTQDYRVACDRSRRASHT